MDIRERMANSGNDKTFQELHDVSPVMIQAAADALHQADAPHQSRVIAEELSYDRSAMQERVHRALHG